MARRGITYEDVPRLVGPKDLPEAEDQEEFDEKVAPLLPSAGVGLLFMAYNVNLDQQFETTQMRFSEAGIGTDPVIGQTATVSTQTWHTEWKTNALPTKPFSLQGFVHLKGGDYFFAPSLITLKRLA